MLEIIAIGQVGIWLMEFVNSITMSGFIYILLMITVVVILARVIQGHWLLTMPVHNRLVHRIELKMTLAERETGRKLINVPSTQGKSKLMET